MKPSAVLNERRDLFDVLTRGRQIIFRDRNAAHQTDQRTVLSVHVRRPGQKSCLIRTDALHDPDVIPHMDVVRAGDGALFQIVAMLFEVLAPLDPKSETYGRDRPDHDMQKRSHHRPLETHAFRLVHIGIIRVKLDAPVHMDFQIMLIGIHGIGVFLCLRIKHKIRVLSCSGHCFRT